MRTKQESIITLKGRSGFTLVELLIVVAIIIALVALIVPGMSHIKRQALKAAAKSQMNALQMALASYHDDFKRHPVSSSTPQPYTQIAVGRGPALLAQGLVGFLPGDVDGAGPPNAGDPTNGFRVNANAAVMGGKIYGPYASLESKQYKVLSPTDQYFIDPWGKEILYFRSRHQVIRPNAKVTKIFLPAPPGESAFFDPADCSVPPPGLNPPGNPTTAGSVAFFQLLGAPADATDATKNNVIGTVVGADSYLLISAGPDMTYFTADDIVVGK